MCLKAGLKTIHRPGQFVDIGHDSSRYYHYSAESEFVRAERGIIQVHRNEVYRQVINRMGFKDLAYFRDR